MTSKIESINKRFESMKAEFQNWKSAFQNLSKYIKPTRGWFDAQVSNKGKMIDHQTIVDGHAARCLRIMSTGMMNGLTNPSTIWFRLGLQDPDLTKWKPIRVWLDLVAKIMMDVYQSSNIYDSLYSTYEESGQFGTACFLVQEDPDDIIRSHFYTVGEYFLACDDNGRVNAFGREFYMTVLQMVKKYGLEKCSDNVKRLYKNNQVDEWIKIRQLIEYNDDRIISRYNNRNFMFRSCHWEDGNANNKFLLESGYRSFPNMAPRWEVTSTSQIYGYSPAWDSLGDIRMLHTMQKDKLEAVAKVINPPMLVDDAIKGSEDFLPGGITYGNTNNNTLGARTLYQINPDIKAMEQAILTVKSDISKSFYNDLFMMFANNEDSRITATEVAKRHEEKLIMLGSVLMKLEQECLDKLIERTYDILLTRGVLPPAPEEAQGHNIKVEYISILAQAQKMVKTSTIERTVGFIGQVAAAKPAIMDLFDEDELGTEYSNMMGLPPNILRDKEEVAAIRADRQKQQEKMQYQEDMHKTSEIAKNLGSAKLNKDQNALGALAGMNEGVNV